MVILSLLLPLNQPLVTLLMATDHALTVRWHLMVDFCRLKIMIKGSFVLGHSVSIIPPRIDQFSSDHWSQTRTGRVSTYMGDRLGIPCVLSTFFIWFWLNRTWGIHFWPYQCSQRPSWPQNSNNWGRFEGEGKLESVPQCKNTFNKARKSKTETLLIPFLSPISIV